MRSIGLDPAKHLDTDPYEPTYAMLDAPRGKHFKSENTHSVPVGDDRKSDMYAAIINHCSQGLGDCSETPCDSCAEEARFAAARGKLGPQFH
jgi:hypothetical protein